MQSDTKFWCLDALFDLSIKLPDLFQETINLVTYGHFLGSSRSGHPVTSSYGVKLPRVHENLLGHLSRVYREASVGSWSTVSRWVGYVVGSSFFCCCRLSKVGSIVARGWDWWDSAYGESPARRRLHVSLIIAAFPGPRLICFWCHRQAWGRVSHSQS